ncbi:MAG: TonB-dependent receptor [Planctomycetes bacterium]|nr:TonB-dependent receptor [Planctomycetota bacterium]
MISFVVCAVVLYPQAETSQEKKVVVTASPLKPEDVFDVPYSTDVVRRQEMEERLSRTLPELLKEIPGINVQKTSNGHGSPFIRGFTGFRNVFLIDGIRLNNSGFREGPNQYWNTVDSFLIDRLEVLRGPASVLYGSDAIGGVVYVHTRTIEKLPDAFAWSARTHFRYASAENSFTERQEVTLADPAGAFLGGVTVRDFNDVAGGRHTGEQPNTGYDEYDVDAKVVVPLAPKQTLVVAAQSARQDDVPRTHRTLFAKEWHGTAVGSDRRLDFDQERDLVYAQLTWDQVATFIDSMVLSLSVHRTFEDSLRVRSTGAQEFREFEIVTPGFFAKLGKDTAWGYVTFGLEYYRDAVKSDGFDRDAAGVQTDFERGEISDDTTVDLAGVYVQNEYELLKGLDVTAGVRYNYERIDAGVVDPSGFGGPSLTPFTETYTAVVGSLRLLYRASEHVNLIGGVSQGFRAPNLDDTTAVRLVLSGQTDFPNPDLDPERSINFEVGTRFRSGGLEAQCFAFYTVLDDFITRVPAPALGPSAFTKENVSEGWVKGVEVGASYRIDAAWSVRADVTWSIGNLDAVVGGQTEERPISKMNPATAHVGVRWQADPKGPWVEGVATAVRKQTRLSPSDLTDTQRIPPGGTPGFTVLSVRGGAPISAAATATVAVEDIGNRDYRFHGSGQNEPGTNFIAGVDVRF